MTTRLGIELAPDACRVVEVDVRPAGRGPDPATRVRSFAALPPSGPDMAQALIGFGRRDAAVVVWGPQSQLRPAIVAAGRYRPMRAEALRALADAGIAIDDMWADIAPLPVNGAAAARRAVLVALASASEMRAALEPVTDAGIRVRAVMTPAIALSAIARRRAEFCKPGAIEAHVAIERTAACVALARDGEVVAAAVVGLESGASIGDGLVDALRGYFDAADAPADAVRRISVCGGIADLRAVAADVASRLDAEVDVIESLFGIDVTRLPEPAAEFRARGSELRLAWAAAVDEPPALNLIRTKAPAASRRWMRAAVGAGIAAGLVAGWQIEESDWFAALDVRAMPSARAASPPVSLSAPLPFEGAVLGTILYSDDHQAAVVDGRIVMAGDEIRGARVVKITRDAVMVRDGSGAVRQLTHSRGQ